HGGRAEAGLLAQPQVRKIGLADADRALQYRVEYKLQLARRAADDMQDLRGCGLLLLGVPELVGEARDLAPVLFRPRFSTARSRRRLAAFALCRLAASRLHCNAVRARSRPTSDLAAAAHRDEVRRFIRSPRRRAEA